MAVALAAEKREKTGKYIAFDLRKQGKVPAVMYGEGVKENVNLAVNQKELKKVLASGARLLDLNLDGAVHLAVLKAVQHETIGSNLLHADFRAVTENSTLHLNVEVVLKGEAIGTAAGGIVEQNLHQIIIECMPKNLPAHIELDISDLTVGKVLFVSELPAYDGVKYITHAEVPVVSCRLKAEEAAAAPVVAATDATVAAPVGTEAAKTVAAPDKKAAAPADKGKK
jgi:large subunit ribosomal protein L25